MDRRCARSRDRRGGGHAIQARLEQRFELLAKRADQRLPFRFVVPFIRHGRDLDATSNGPSSAGTLDRARATSG